MTFSNQPEPCHLQVGTSGYSYAEWVEAGFYPRGTRSGQMLPVYARAFRATEINYTWYQMPRAPTIDRMRRLAPDGFCFTAKLTRTLTHEVDPSAWRSQAVQYREGIAPLVQAGQLAAILLQFPPSFARVAQNRIYLGKLLDALTDLPVAVEFRHASWATDRVFAELQQRRAALVAVDTPSLPGLFPRLDVVTNPDLFYVRFHGRNTGGWRSGNMQKQFDYDYADAELAEWVNGPIQSMAEQAKAGVVFFNNHVRAQAPRNARMLIDLLETRGILERRSQ